MILQQALAGLGIDKQFKTAVKYSDQFNNYGANIRMRGDAIVLKLSRAWIPISDEIKIGIAQELLVGLFKIKKNTLNMDLYAGFIRNLHIAAPKEKPDEELLHAFNRVNEQYFFGMMDMPNIVWGDHTVRKLGSYDYRADKITLSKVLDKRPDFLDLVMHHELLHKKHKFTAKNGRSLHHSAAFRKEEKLFDNFEEKEQELKRYLVKSNLRRLFSFW
jgi:predicted metal-dependent hydrolase